jgi:mediator of RNA polymerase II transcription subunit 18
LGQPELGDKNRATLVRSCVDVNVSGNVSSFLEEMSFKLDFEYLSKGFIFKKGRMKIIVAKISRLPDNVTPSNVSNAEPFLITHSYLVELTVVAPSGEQEGLADEIKAFANQLKPLVNLDKIDHRRLQVQL